MCIFGNTPKPTAAPVIAAPGSDATRRQADLEARLRRRRAGAAADILTSPLGLSGGAMTTGAPA